MAKKLVLANLIPSVTEEVIRNFLFDQGEISAVELIQSPESRQAYAYVTMDQEQDAANIVRKFNGQIFLGQEVSISRVA